MQQDDGHSLPGSQSPERITADDLPIASSSKFTLSQYLTQSSQNKANNTPTLHMHDPRRRLPSPPEYCNPSHYVFQAQVKQAEVQSQRSGGGSVKRKDSPDPSAKSKKGKVIGLEDDSSEDDTLPKFKKQFNRFHEENGVRIVVGSIGPVQNGGAYLSYFKNHQRTKKDIYSQLFPLFAVRMLLKAGYRHVYISRKFAIKHSFLPADAAPGHYGYGGLVNIGKWPIKLVPSHSQPNKRRRAGYQRPDAFDHRHLSVPSPPPSRNQMLAQRSHPSSTLQSPTPSFVAAPQDGNSLKSIKRTKQKTTVPNDRAGNEQTTNNQKEVIMDVYLSEEPHFDVVLGRSFFEKRQVKVSTVDPTDVVCLDTGEKIECELVILKDGRGEIVTVT